MAKLRGTSPIGRNPERTKSLRSVWPIVFDAELRSYPLLLVPLILFLCSLYIPPKIHADSGVGFLALRSMAEGGAFNSITAPDPVNIATDSVYFVSWWSPGQYLVPGSFIWLG